jgi:hypothetical protein
MRRFGLIAVSLLAAIMFASGCETTIPGRPVAILSAPTEPSFPTPRPTRLPSPTTTPSTPPSTTSTAPLM